MLLRRSRSSAPISAVSASAMAFGSMQSSCPRTALDCMLVRSRRLELPRPFGHSDLNAARLPVPPRPHVHENGRPRPSLLVRECASIKAIPTAQWRRCDPGSGQCLTPCLPLAVAGVTCPGDRDVFPRSRPGWNCRRSCSPSADRPGDRDRSDPARSSDYRERGP